MAQAALAADRKEQRLQETAERRRAGDKLAVPDPIYLMARRCGDSGGATAPASQRSLAQTWAQRRRTCAAPCPMLRPPPPSAPAAACVHCRLCAHRDPAHVAALEVSCLRCLQAVTALCRRSKVVAQHISAIQAVTLDNLRNEREWDRTAAASAGGRGRHAAGAGACVPTTSHCHTCPDSAAPVRRVCDGALAQAALRTPRQHQQQLRGQTAAPRHQAQPRAVTRQQRRQRLGLVWLTWAFTAAWACWAACRMARSHGSWPSSCCCRWPASRRTLRW